MAQYTTTMWWMRNELDLTLDELFPKIYEFYDEKAKKDFQELFYDHYFDREIGFETYSLFRHKLKAKLNLIMPRYKNIYDTNKLVIDPLNEYEETETYTKDQNDKVRSDGTSTADSNYQNKSDGTSETINSDTPQGYLKPSDLTNYATDISVTNDKNASDQTGKTKSDSKSTSDRESLENLDKKVKGRRSSQMKLIAEYQALYRNLNEMIIHECKDLFMGVF